jgi:NitT/TauT family transport system substrate-binding protein
MSGPRARWFSLSLAAVVIMAGAAACSSSASTASSSSSSASSSSSVGSSSSAGSSSSSQGLELTSVNVDALDIASTVALQIAQDQGLFKKEGLTVTVNKIAASNLTTAPLLAHTLDFASDDYVGAYRQNVNAPTLDLKVVADAEQAAKGVYALMVPKGSKITSPAQLAGKKIAVPSAGPGIPLLSTDALLSSYHVKAGNYQVVQVSFPGMPAAFAHGEVDAAWVSEPFVTILEETGAKVLADPMTGALNAFPVGCWVTTGWFAQHYPKTTAAFARAMVAAQQLAASNPTLVRKELTSWIPTLKPALANVISLGVYDTTISLTRMNRVSDVMKEYNELPQSFSPVSMTQLPSGA